MSRRQLLDEMRAGVRCWDCQQDSETLVGVMGIQQVRDTTLVRHAHMCWSLIKATALERVAGGASSPAHRPVTGQLMAGTWAAAQWDSLLSTARISPRLAGGEGLSAHRLLDDY
ncbi:MAG: hypothetical protein JO249_12210 [Acidobacteria bacterium]|nr:hypothetical protein [Acidobacteriota bacterium]